MSTSLLETHLCPATTVERDRLLPAPGRVTVGLGEHVQASAIVAQAQLAGSLYMMPAALALGTSRHNLSRYMCVREDDTVTKGTLLASRGWSISRNQVHSPVDGTIQAITDGQILIKRSRPPCQLAAHIPGEIVHIYPERGVRIRSYGLLIGGVWGCGKETSGVLATVTPIADTLTWDQVSLRYRGTILVAGHIQDERALYRAKQFRLKGIITGGLATRLVPIATQLAFPIVVTEGLAKLCLPQQIFRLLEAARGQQVILSTGQNGQAPEVLVPAALKPAVGPTLPMVRPVEKGAWVRLIRPPYLGAIATVEAIATQPQLTAIGTHSRGAQVRLPNGRRVFVPLVNMELLDGLELATPAPADKLSQMITGQR